MRPRRTSRHPNPGDPELDMPGKLIYEYSPQVTRVVDYGASAEALLSGQVSPPPEGARIDFYLEGPVIGPRLKGTISGVDYLYFRADGRAELHIHAEITTEEEEKDRTRRWSHRGSQGRIFGVSACRENVTLLTNHTELAWVNALKFGQLERLMWRTVRFGLRDTPFDGVPRVIGAPPRHVGIRVADGTLLPTAAADGPNVDVASRTFHRGAGQRRRFGPASHPRSARLKGFVHCRREGMQIHYQVRTMHALSSPSGHARLASVRFRNWSSGGWATPR